MIPTSPTKQREGVVMTREKHIAAMDAAQKWASIEMEIAIIGRQPSAEEKAEYRGEALRKIFEILGAATSECREAALIGCVEHMEWSTPKGKDAHSAAVAAIAKAKG